MTSPSTIDIVRPRAGTVQANYTGRDVAQAYNMLPPGVTGKGATIGYIELGGGIDVQEVARYLSENHIVQGNTFDVRVILIDTAKNEPDGPNGADGEVLLDVEVGISVAPSAQHRVYFAPNTDDGFLNAIQRAGRECDIVSISWGAAETQWSREAIQQYSAVFKELRGWGVKVFAASGDNGSRDGESQATTDYPASDPNVIACGGTQLRLTGHGARDSEVAWDDDDSRSASGGGVSKVFPGRQVPDVAGNASPVTGYKVLVDGQRITVGGTSAVAPLYAGFAALVKEATKGLQYDFLNAVVTNPQALFDVTVGDNGDYRAGPGRDLVTGFGVVDGARFIAALTSGIPAPVPPAPPVVVPPPPTEEEVATMPQDLADRLIAWAHRTVGRFYLSKTDRKVAQDFLDWVEAQ